MLGRGVLLLGRFVCFGTMDGVSMEYIYMYVMRRYFLQTALAFGRMTIYYMAMGSEFAFDIRDNILCALVSRYYRFPMMMMLLLGSSSIFGVRPWTLWKFALVGEQDRGGE